MPEAADILSAVRASMEQAYAQATTSDHGELPYHNWAHTLRVYAASQAIAQGEAVGEHEQFLLGLAAYFHDVGYLEDKDNHERRSADRAMADLEAAGMSTEDIAVVERLIMATRMLHGPTDHLEQIIKDADLAHLGSSDYFDTTYFALQQEMKACMNPDMTPSQWQAMCVQFMQEHDYYTAYARDTFGPQKAENLAKIKALATAMEQQDTTAPASEKAAKGKKKKGKPKSDIPEKGIETMFRVSLRNHTNLSRIADNKANTLISVNAIIISIVLSAMFPKMDTNPFLIYPGLALILFSIATIIVSILSTIPKTSHGQLTREEVADKKGNLIFFGNFHKMSLEDYEWGVSELMQDRDYLYKSLTRDLYFLGKVLHRKYTLLRYSYYIFVVGLLTSIVLFAISLNGMQV